MLSDNRVTTTHALREQCKYNNALRDTVDSIVEHGSSYLEHSDVVNTTSGCFNGHRSVFAVDVSVFELRRVSVHPIQPTQCRYAVSSRTINSSIAVIVLLQVVF